MVNNVAIFSQTKFAPDSVQLCACVMPYTVHTHCTLEHTTYIHMTTGDTHTHTRHTINSHIVCHSSRTRGSCLNIISFSRLFLLWSFCYLLRTPPPSPPPFLLAWHLCISILARCMCHFGEFARLNFDTVNGHRETAEFDDDERQRIYFSCHVVFFMCGHKLCLYASIRRYCFSFFFLSPSLVFL